MSDVAHILREQGEAARVLLANIRDVIGDDEDMALVAVEGETDLKEAIADAVDRLAEIDALTTAIAIQAKALSERKSRLENQSERIRAAILNAMAAADLKKLELPAATLSRKNAPAKVIITSEADLPSQFLIERTEVKPDRKALLEALKDGHVISGAELSNGGEHLQVRMG